MYERRENKKPKLLMSQVTQKNFVDDKVIMIWHIAFSSVAKYLSKL